MYMKEAHKDSVGNPNAFGDPHHAGSGAGSNQIMEDERDPDVIPAQFGENCGLILPLHTFVLT